MTKVNLYICENYAPEFTHLCEKNKWTDVSVIPFPPMCLNKRKKGDTAKLLIESASNDSEGIVLCSKNCDMVSLNTDLEIHSSNYCFSHLASEPFIEYVLSKGGYIISSGWLKNWRERIAEAGFDRETAISFYKGFSRELVFFDAGVFRDSEKYLLELSQYLELPYVVIPTGLEGTRMLIEMVVSQQRLHVSSIDNIKTISEMESQCSEYAAIFDLMGRIAAYANKRDAIEKVKEIFMMVFGAQQFKYWNNEYDKDSFPIEILDLLSEEGKDYFFQKKKIGFASK